MHEIVAFCVSLLAQLQIRDKLHELWENPVELISVRIVIEPEAPKSLPENPLSLLTVINIRNFELIK